MNFLLQLVEFRHQQLRCQNPVSAFEGPAISQFITCGQFSGKVLAKAKGGHALTFAAMPERIILFDGLCNLCSSSVQFVLRRDKKKLFHFASLQSDFGQQVLKDNNLPATALNSFILLEHGKLYTKSTGALRLARSLGGLWPLLYGFVIIPPFIRDAVYSFIANNRYKWFGKKEACWIPTPELRSRFL